MTIAVDLGRKATKQTNKQNHRIYQLDKTFCFLILRANYRNLAMLFDETLIELFESDDILLDKVKCFVMKKNVIYSTSTQILESVYVPGHTILGISKR